MFNKNRGTGSDRLDKYLAKLGYAYDPGQDIFYSTLDAWQRKYGYCRFYDEAAPFLSMIIDCEPITFDYSGKRWLIQFWKGQYALSTGCEIGVYRTGKPDIDIPGIYRGPFYMAVDNVNLLHLSFTLIKNGKMLFSREGKHWWQTGFILGGFSEPDELMMNLSVTLKDEKMLNAFVDGLKRAGYEDSEISINGTRVSLLFAEPRTQQPVTRNPETDWIIQRKNEYLCKKYRDITKQFETIPGKFQALKKRAPGLYRKAIDFRNTARLLARYGALRRNQALL